MKKPEPKVWTDRECFVVAYATVCRLLGHDTPQTVPDDVSGPTAICIKEVMALIKQEASALEALRRAAIARFDA